MNSLLAACCEIETKRSKQLSLRGNIMESVFLKSENFNPHFIIKIKSNGLKYFHNHLIISLQITA